MKTSSLAACKYFLLALLIACGTALADDDSNTVNSLTNLNPALGTYGGSSYPLQLYNSLSKEDANRWYEQGFGNFVSTTANVNACLGGTSAGLTMTPTACVAYNAGYRGTETGSITFSNAATTWVAMDENTSGNNANLPNFTRVNNTHYLIDSIDVSAPTMAFDSQLLMKVVTTGGAITAVTDERTTKVPGNILPPANQTWTVAQGGTGATTLTAHGVLIGEGTSPIAAVTCGSNLFLAGVAASDPACRAIATTDVPGFDGVTVTGTPSAGQVVTATSSSAAHWASITSRSDLQTGNPLVTVSNSTAETTLATYTLAGGTLTSHGTLRCHAEGNYLNNSGGGTSYTLKFYYGASAINTALASTAPYSSSATTAGWIADALVSTTGATNTEWSSVHIQPITAVADGSSVAGAIAQTYSRNATVAVDSTANQTVKLTVSMTTNTSTQTFSIYTWGCQLQ